MKIAKIKNELLAQKKDRFQKICNELLDFDIK